MEILKILPSILVVKENVARTGQFQFNGWAELKLENLFTMFQMLPKVNFRINWTFILMIGVAYLFVVSNVIKVNPRSLYVYSGFNSLASDGQNQTNLEHFVPSSKFEKESNVKPNYTLITLEFFKYLTKQLEDKPYAGVDNFTQYVIANFNLKPLAGVTPIQPEFGPVLNDVTSYQYPITIEPCRYLNGTSNIFVAIISAVGNLQRRSEIRQSWIKHLPILRNQSENFTSVSLSGYSFIIGQTKDQKLQLEIEEESKKHGDILQINFIDDYYNLTLKATGLVNWLYNYCSGIDFVLKVDDDVYVNVRNLGAVVTKSLNRSEKIVYGSEIRSHSADKHGKWKIDYEKYPWSNYPIFPNGPSILFTGIVIKPLLAATQVVPFLPFEDVYLLGLCTEKARIKLYNANRLRAIGDHVPCQVYNSIGWHSGSSESFNRSHLATENFYKNVTQCIQVRDGVNQTMNPFNYDLKM